MVLFRCLVPQDAKPLEVYSVEFMVDNNQLGFLGKVITLVANQENAVPG
jgi:hypothetical protein